MIYDVVPVQHIASHIPFPCEARYSVRKISYTRIKEFQGRIIQLAKHIIDSQ